MEGMVTSGALLMIPAKYELYNRLVRSGFFVDRNDLKVVEPDSLTDISDMW
jgi:hypothetical protein